MAKLLLYSFFSYFIKIFSFSPLYLLRLLALYCGLRVVLSYRSILLHFFCYFGPRSFSHIVHSWGIGSNPVPFVKFDIWWRLEIVALAMWMWTDMEYLVIVAPYGWRGIYILDFRLFYDNAFCVLQLAATYAQKVCDIGIFCYCVMLLLIKVRFSVSHLFPSMDLGALPFSALSGTLLVTLCGGKQFLGFHFGSGYFFLCAVL